MRLSQSQLTPARAFDQRTNLLYLRLHQTFSIWFLPFHQAPVRLISILHLTPTSANGSASSTDSRPYDAASEKRRSIQEGIEPSYAEVASGASRSRSGSRAGSTSSMASQHHHHGPTEYQIFKQEDVYQVNEFVKFVMMAPGAWTCGMIQLVVTLFCAVGELLLRPMMRAAWPVNHRGQKEKGA